MIVLCLGVNEFSLLFSSLDELDLLIIDLTGESCDSAFELSPKIGSSMN